MKNANEDITPEQLEKLFLTKFSNKKYALEFEFDAQGNLHRIQSSSGYYAAITLSAMVLLMELHQNKNLYNNVTFPGAYEQFYNILQEFNTFYFRMWYDKKVK